MRVTWIKFRQIILISAGLAFMALPALLAFAQA
jgi:hypothetical protein